MTEMKQSDIIVNHNVSSIVEVSDQYHCNILQYNISIPVK